MKTLELLGIHRKGRFEVRESPLHKFRRVSPINLMNFFKDLQKLKCVPALLKTGIPQENASKIFTESYRFWHQGANFMLPNLGCFQMREFQITHISIIVLSGLLLDAATHRNFSATALSIPIKCSR